MVSNNYRSGLRTEQEGQKFFELLSAPSEGNVFESVGTRGYVLLHIVELRVLADAAMAVVRGLVSWKTAVDGAFAIQTCDVCDAGKRRAVLADGGVGRERNSAATTFFFGKHEETSNEDAVSITKKKTRGV